MRRIALVMLLPLIAPAATSAGEPPRAPAQPLEAPARPLVRPAPVAPPQPATAPIRATTIERPVPVPNGSYLRTCRAPRATASMLHAECDAGREGRWIASSLPWPKCAGADISNRNGRLVCVTPVRANWGDAVLPPGSWFDSCWGSVEQGWLKARCKTGSGEVKVLGLTIEGEGTTPTALDLARCPDGSDIANIRGQLTCVAR
ncbi:CVNH domain-containing protein [Lysobacter sp. N42]|uniref:CVNH domain-containing protein n=1 Tax=Lysobacter sp. N42 TaxID=2545719 RepID=UPI00105358EE|nr:CVNH domain-containing protein [Lysobacter sp. N42]TCZ82071.1 hypothetical protein EYQ95_23430 [Lysobacter sp. N42]